MTVKELLVNVGFDAIMEALKKMHPNDRSITDTAGYKEAFDIICNTEFDGEGGEVGFDVWDDSHSLTAYYVEGDSWENSVGKIVIRPDDDSFTDADLAASILWGMTFYGFTRHAQWEPREEPFTQFGVMAAQLERKLYLPYIRDMRTRQSLKRDKEMPFGIAFPMEVWDRIHYCKRHQNRAKRKRFYRMKRRIAHLKRLDKRQHLLYTIAEKAGFRDSQLADRIINAGSIHEHWRESHVYGRGSRIEYLNELLTNYTPSLYDLSEIYSEMLVMTYTSEDSPLTAEEETRLREIVSVVAEKRQINATLIKGNDNETKGEIALQIIGISPVKPDDDYE
ncbi:MAG: hypothetical protein L6U16_10560 [Porphyromonadaceae bacterium]|nr:MAG: hypothetical protein L6U16_10560 [Porphyromonadaceae bacterium]